MNCKPGDLAIIVRSFWGNEGKIVRCLSLNTQRSSWPLSHPTRGLLSPEPVWNIEGHINGPHGSKMDYAVDSCLRPIRDPGDDAVDETLLRLPSPRQEVTA